MPTPRDVEARIRAYARDLDRLMRRARRHDVRDLVRLRRVWRRFKARALARIPDNYELNQAAIPSILHAVAEELDLLRTELRGAIRQGMEQRAQLAREVADRFGVLFLPEPRPLDTTGAEARLLDVAEDFSARLIGVREGGLSARVLSQVDAELRLAVMGVHTGEPFGAMAALGRALRGVRGWIYETERIYRTEVNRVFSLVMESEIRRIGQVMPVMKRWVWSGIAREEHARINGQTVPMRGKFRVPKRPTRRDPRTLVRMRYPRDPLAPPEATVNCGCWHVPVPAEASAREEFEAAMAS